MTAKRLPFDDTIGPQLPVATLLDKFAPPKEAADGYQARFKPTPKNMRTILERDTRWSGRIWRNDFTGLNMVKTTTGTVRPWVEQDEQDIWAFFQTHYGFDPKSGAALCRAVNIVATRDGVKRNPLHEYLVQCRRDWDKVPRLDSWMTEYLGVKTVFDRECYADVISAVGRCWMIGAVRRAFTVTGTKLDNVLILKGPQGSYKSTALRVLAGDDFFSDSMMDIKNKDAFQNIRGVWIYEFSELDNMRRSQATAVKAFLSSTKDRYRPAFGSAVVDVPRHTVFCGTTNESQFLTDTTGNRRFWPVETGTIQINALIKNRDHLWAEAYEAVRQKENHYLDDDLIKKYEMLKRTYVQRHPWEPKVMTWVEGKGFVTVNEILENPMCLNKPTERWTRADQIIVADILKSNGWNPTRRNGVRGWRK